MKRNMLYRTNLRLAGIVGILVGTAVAAPPATPVQPPPAAVTPAPASTNAQDYSQGFRTFLRMGLPDTSKAKYVKLEAYGGMHDQGMYRMYEVQLSGNAWLISENKDDKSVLVSSSGRRMELLDQKTYMKKQEAEARSNALTQAAATAKDGGKKTVRSVTYRAMAWAESGAWTPVDLSRDLAKATAFVDKKIKAKAAGGREMRYDSFLQTDEPAGMLFLLATFAWQNGKVEEANALAGRLFTLVGDSRKVIVGGLNVVADAQLLAATDAFGKTRDWQAYQVQVADLLKKYPAGWRQAGAAKLLADRLQARAALTEPPAIKGDGLDAEDQKLAAALVSETNRSTRMNVWGGQLWILPPPAKGPRGMVMAQAKDETALGRITERGVKSIPLLIAMASDETLCPLRRNEAGMPTYGSHYSSEDARKSDAERAQMLYDRMDRPLSRGEIARSLLAPLCPRDERERHGEEPSVEETIEGARQAYAALKALPPAAMARHFMEKGDRNQKQAAVNYLLETDVETNAPAIEAFLLAPPSDESEGMWRGFDGGLAQQYVQKRGEKAAEFVEKYAALRKKIELPAGMADNAQYVKQMEKQAEREIKTLRALVKKQDLSQVVADVANAGDENEAAMAAYSTLGRQKPAVAVPALLAVAVKTTNVTVRARVLQMMPMLRYSGMEEQMESAQAEEVDEAGMESAMKKLADKNKLNIGTNAAEWKVLLADDRPMPGRNMFGAGGANMTVADMAATSIESLYGDVSAMERHGFWGGAGSLRPDVAMKIARARAAARLEGKTEDQLPKMPSADDVTADRRKAIETEVTKAPPAQLGAMLDKLTDSETLYLAEAENENENVKKALAPLARRIGSVKAAPVLPAEEAARLQKLEGTAVTTNAVAEMREVCKRQLAAGKAVVVSLSSAGLGRGLRLEVTATDESTQRMYGSGYASMMRSSGGVRKGMVIGALQNNQNYGHSMWLVDLPAVAKAAATTGTVAKAAADSDDDASDRIESFAMSFASQQEQFETAADTFCKPDESLGQAASVTFTGMLPPEKKDKRKSEDDEETDEDFGMMME